MNRRTTIGVGLVVGSLLIGLALTIVAAIVSTGSWWFLLGVPLWVGLALIWWDALTT